MQNPNKKPMKCTNNKAIQIKCKLKIKYNETKQK